MFDLDGLLSKYRGVEGERFFNDVFEGEEYKPVKVEQVIIDIGALAGEFCAYIYDQARIIYALEPTKDHFDELIGNIKGFKMGKVKPYKLAIAGSNGRRHLEVMDRGGSRLIGQSDDPGRRGEVVETKTIAQFMKDEKIDHVDILKIDIESAEDEVFQATDFKEVAGKIDVIIGEHLGGSQVTLQDLGFTKEEHSNNLVFRRRAYA